MPGWYQELIPRQTFDFGDVKDSGVMDYLVARGIDATAATEGVLELRVYAATIPTATTNGKVEVLVYSELPSGDDLATDFVDPTPVATVAIDADVSEPTLERAALSSGFGAFLRIVVRGTQASTASSMGAGLSGGLTLKS